MGNWGYTVTLLIEGPISLTTGDFGAQTFSKGGLWHLRGLGELCRGVEAGTNVVWRLALFDQLG